MQITTQQIIELAKELNNDKEFNEMVYNQNGDNVAQTLLGIETELFEIKELFRTLIDVIDSK